MMEALAIAPGDGLQFMHVENFAPPPSRSCSLVQGSALGPSPLQWECWKTQNLWESMCGNSKATNVSLATTTTLGAEDKCVRFGCLC